jgi:hypothetical protein
MTEFMVKDIALLSKESFVETVIHQLSTRYSGFEISVDQSIAWGVSAGWVYDAATEITDTHGHCLFYFEFSPAFISRRSDFLFISKDEVVVFEAKTGVKHTLSAAKRQVVTYARDIFNYLDAGSKMLVKSCVIQTHGSRQDVAPTMFDISEPNESTVAVIGSNELASFLRKLTPAQSSDDLSPNKWLYHPRPSIVDAARLMFSGVEDSDKLKFLSEDEEIENLTNQIVSLIEEAKASRSHQVIAISGVPGAGKTLVGLKLAHEEAIQNVIGEGSPPPIYLTGNGPLVSVLTEVLARDLKERTGSKIGEAREVAQTKIRRVHAITQDGFPSATRVVVFDEAQRAWNENHMRRKHSNQNLRSEPEELLLHLEKLPWAVLICLIGTGQNIHDGEDGFQSWIAAVKQRNNDSDTRWTMRSAQDGIAGTYGPQFEYVPELFLSVVRRTNNASGLSSWVDAVLELDSGTARKLRQEFEEFPMVVTRDLDVMKGWLRNTTYFNVETIGLVASSRSGRLPIYGIDPQSSASTDHDWTQWFLDRPPNLNSSIHLEIAASEFKCQGLELDRVGVCWAWDFVPNDGDWLIRKLNRRTGKWQRNNQTEFAINTYRVLLTRARNGLAIWVPQGDHQDSTRNVEQMDRVFELLVNCGCDVLGP